MDARTRAFITSEVLTLAEIGTLYGIPTNTARKRAERGGWDYVLKSGVRLYLRSDLPHPVPQYDPPPGAV